MTDEAISAKPYSQAVPHDWFLQLLVNFANSGLDIGITLHVGGLLVSGNFASGKAYFAGAAQDLSSCFSDQEVAQSVNEDIAKYGDIYNKKDDDVSPPPQYIHLSNARFFNTSGNPIPENRGVWWRGRISEVVGFSLGRLGKAEV